MMRMSYFLICVYIVGRGLQEESDQVLRLHGWKPTHSVWTLSSKWHGDAQILLPLSSISFYAPAIKWQGGI